MCGIAGIISFNNNEKSRLSAISNATKALQKRGPDSEGTFLHNHVALGHRRLSIIDVTDSGAQPMKDETGRFVIIFNGEIYNYRELKQHLLVKGYTFTSESDTEVLLKLFIEYRENCLEKLNGFFAFSVYDTQTETLFIARDRIGIKPLLYYKDDEQFVFASEMKAIMALNIGKEISFTSLLTYLQLNYIPAPATIFQKVHKLLPGHYIITDSKGNFRITKYYTIQQSKNNDKINQVAHYNDAIKKLKELLSHSVKKRLIADVPLGTFLSGGIDSSVVSFLASQYSPNINTFSIGFKDEPYFDETRYASLVSKKIKTNHTVFSLSNNDLFENLFDILDYIDEPFADSSAIAVYILSKYTRQKVTVALSGDGADEMFGGYNKHAAEYKVRNAGVINKLIKIGSPLFESVPKSRNSKFSNLSRQLSRYAEGLNLSPQNRYWRWCAFENEAVAMNLFSEKSANEVNKQEYELLKKHFTDLIQGEKDLNDLLYTDMHLVLPNDMLQKVDLMSMANALEVRVPFLDHEVVDYAFSLPSEYKIDRRHRKKIVIDAFKNDLPEEIFTRPKHGFEVPLLKWFCNELNDLIFNNLLSEKFISEQNIFNPKAISLLKNRLMSSSPGDAQAQVWALLVFQYWWKKYYN
jgi:asparagine synthase (glutamine-hydrolysing)